MLPSMHALHEKLGLQQVYGHSTEDQLWNTRSLR